MFQNYWIEFLSKYKRWTIKRKKYYMAWTSISY